MSEITSVENEYVPMGLFDLHLQSIKERASSDKELVDRRFERLETIIEKNFELLNEKIEHTTDTLTIAINGTNNRIDGIEKRIDDLHNSHNKWFAVFGILITVVPIAIAIVQSFIAK